jgi:hypothetical protein
MEVLVNQSIRETSLQSLAMIVEKWKIAFLVKSQVFLNQSSRLICSLNMQPCTRLIKENIVKDLIIFSFINLVHKKTVYRQPRFIIVLYIEIGCGQQGREDCILFWSLLGQAVEALWHPCLLLQMMKNDLCLPQKIL